MGDKIFFFFLCGCEGLDYLDREIRGSMVDGGFWRLLVTGITDSVIGDVCF